MFSMAKCSYLQGRYVCFDQNKYGEHLAIWRCGLANLKKEENMYNVLRLCSS